MLGGRKFLQNGRQEVASPHLNGHLISAQSRPGTPFQVFLESSRMRFLNSVTVFVIAVMTAQANLNAADEVQAPTPTQASSGQDSSAPRQTLKARLISTAHAHPDFYQGGIQPNGFDQYRREPSLGCEGSPSHGYKHFGLPLTMFGNWYRPRASTLTPVQRCAPDAFRPRGFGHLFARPCDSYRMEYTPSVLKENRSEYGPTYLLHDQDKRCDDCDHRR